MEMSAATNTAGVLWKNFCGKSFATENKGQTEIFNPHLHQYPLQQIVPENR